MQPPRAEDIIRIEAIELPLVYEKGEGLYEWRHTTTRFYVDLLDLEKELDGLGGPFEGKTEGILDRLQNFRKIYLNVKTGEMST